MLTKIVWTLWALLPVAGLAYHFGPGQRAYTEDRAADVLVAAQRLEALAEQAQEAAYQKHLASLAARRAVRESQSAADAEAAKAAAAQEDAAYRVAADAWKAAADKLQAAHDMLTACGSDKALAVQIARDRALIRAGKIAEGVGDLDDVLTLLSESGRGESALARLAQAELATGCYYGARLLRAAGKPTTEWREVSGWARRTFRYLAETADDSTVEAEASEFQKNLELVLNLEQSPQEDLLAEPLPRNSPSANCNCDVLTKIKRKNKRPQKPGDDRQAGGIIEMGGGW